MMRTILAIIVALVSSVLIAALMIWDLNTLITALQTDPVGNVMIIGALIFAALMHPYTLVTFEIYIPLAALGAAGFIAGLLSKNRIKMLFVSIIVIALFFVGYFVLALGGGLSDFSAMLTEIQTMAIDIGVAFALLLVPGLIGATITGD